MRALSRPLHRCCCARSAASSSSSPASLLARAEARGGGGGPAPPPTTTLLRAMATTATPATRTTAAAEAAAAAAAAPAWTPAGATQDEFMMRDQCIVVDEADNIAGAASKLECHRFGGGGGGGGGGKAAAGASAATTTPTTTTTTTTGRLHRAFSVFLFDASGRLLLQQRARSKITFPGVWTNTCCSHQLHGQPHPGEVDDRAAVEARGAAPGAVRAARRKLAHELGIDPAALPASCFTFVTRLHYCAPDSETHGPDPQWGEHEVDYILLARAPPAPAGAGAGADPAVAGHDGGGAPKRDDARRAGGGEQAAAPSGGNGSTEQQQQQHQHAWEVPPLVPSSNTTTTTGHSNPPSSPQVVIPANRALGRPRLAPDAEEVAAVRWVTPSELEAMMAPGSGLRWSPWFRIIAREWLLPRWWGDLEGALAGRHGDHGRVHRIDC